MIHRVQVRVFDGEPPVEIRLPETLQGYHELWRHIASYQEREPATFQALIRLWTAGDQFFLLRYGMSAGRDAWNEFRNEPHFDTEEQISFSRLIQFDPDINDTVLIGARGLGKSCQFDADDLRALLIDPNFAICFFSLTKSLAEQHVVNLMTEIDKSPLLRSCWPDRFWQSEEERAHSDTPVPWGVGSGFTIKRTTSRPEKSVQAFSFEYQLPTGMHFDRRRYDDIEADRSVRSDVTQDTLEERWISSQNLSSSKRQRRTTGTYYSPNAMMVRLSLDFGMKRVLFPGEDTSRPAPQGEAGPLGGTPSNGFTRDELFEILKQQGGAERNETTGEWRKTTNVRAITDYGRQIACDPLAGEATKLEWKWIRTYEGDGSKYARMGPIIICADCSVGGKDPTWIWVWLLTKEREFWWVDAERKIVQPKERRELIHAVAQKWVNLGADVQQFRVECFGQAQYDIDQREHWMQMPAFPAPRIIKCNDNRSPGRGEGKAWRNYERWQPNASAGKLVFPREMWRMDEREVPVDLVSYFKRYEWDLFPKSKSDNGLDAGGLIWEDAKRVGALPWPADRWDRAMQESRHERKTHWQSAGVA